MVRASGEDVYRGFWHRYWGHSELAAVSYVSVPPGERARIDRTIELIPSDVSSVLDVGCGSGLIANVLADRGFAVTGVDFAEEALTHVRAPTVAASSDALPFDDRAFDLVLAAELLEHLPAGVFERTLVELRRVAARWLLVSSPDHERLELARTLCSRCGTAFHSAGHVRSFGPVEVEGWFDDFELVTAELVGEPAPWRVRSLQLAAQALGDAWYRPDHGVMCPLCHYEVELPRPHAVVRTLNGALQRAAGLVKRPRPYQFVALLRRRDSA